MQSTTQLYDQSQFNCIESSALLLDYYSSIMYQKRGSILYDVICN